MTRSTALPALLLAALLAACGETAKDAGPAPALPPATLDPGDFVAGVTNAYLPFRPGTQWTYASTSSDGDQQIVVTVLSDTKLVSGISATVVHDVVRDAHGSIVENTYDWYAQDSRGNVWYLGEDTTAYDEGKQSKEGSWQTGVDGARAGLIMLAQPKIGASYQQEFYKGKAEDRGRVLALDATVKVPAGSYTGVLQTMDSTPLEPDLVENKWYAKGVGIVRESDVKGGDEQVVLVSMTKP